MPRKVLTAGILLLVLSSLLPPWKPSPLRTFAWQQQLPIPNDLAGWRLYQSTTPGGPYSLVESIPFKTPQTEYRATVRISIPEGETRTLYFVLTAYDLSGNESAFSHETSLILSEEEKRGGYDFIWAKKQGMTLNTSRLLLQIALIVLATGMTSFLVAKRRRSSPRESKDQAIDQKRYYCETCRKELSDQNAADIHRAFKHEVKEGSWGEGSNGGA